MKAEKVVKKVNKIPLYQPDANLLKSAKLSTFFVKMQALANSQAQAEELQALQQTNEKSLTKEEKEKIGKITETADELFNIIFEIFKMLYKTSYVEQLFEAYSIEELVTFLSARFTDAVNSQQQTKLIK